MGENDELRQELLTVDFSIFLTCSLVGLVGASFLEEWKKIGQYLPTTGFYMIVGGIAGSLMLISGDMTRQDVRERYGLDPPIFFLVLLPPIIFDGAFTMKNQLYFWRNIIRIGLLAVVGTLISTIIVVLPTYFLGGLLWPDFGVAASIAFAGLISATDPVASLAVYGSVGVSDRLFSTVFGEATLNDAVAIVIYSVATDLLSHRFGGSTVLHAFISFVLASFASIGIGLGISIVASLLFKHANFIVQNHLFASILMLTFGVLTFMVAQAAHCSGIIATLMVAFSLRHYAYQNLTKESQLLSIHLSKQLASFTEMIVYFQIGFTSLGLVEWNTSFILLSIAWIILGRAVAILLLSLIIRLFFSNRHNPPLSNSEQLVIWHAGLRGSIAMSLAILLPELADPAQNQLLITTTTIIVIWTVFFNGGTTAPLLKLLKLEEPELAEADHHCHACRARNMTLTRTEHLSIAFDAKWVLPFLTHAKFHPNQVVVPSSSSSSSSPSSSSNSLDSPLEIELPAIGHSNQPPEYHHDSHHSHHHHDPHHHDPHHDDPHHEIPHVEEELWVPTRENDTFLLSLPRAAGHGDSLSSDEDGSQDSHSSSRRAVRFHRDGQRTGTPSPSSSPSRRSQLRYPKVGGEQRSRRYIRVERQQISSSSSSSVFGAPEDQLLSDSSDGEPASDRHPSEAHSALTFDPDDQDSDPDQLFGPSPRPYPKSGQEQRSRRYFTST